MHSFNACTLHDTYVGTLQYCTYSNNDHHQSESSTTRYAAFVPPKLFRLSTTCLGIGIAELITRLSFAKLGCFDVQNRFRNNCDACKSQDHPFDFGSVVHTVHMMLTF